MFILKLGTVKQERTEAATRECLGGGCVGALETLQESEPGGLRRLTER